MNGFDEAVQHAVAKRAREQEAMLAEVIGYLAAHSPSGIDLRLRARLVEEAPPSMRWWVEVDGAPWPIRIAPRS